VSDQNLELATRTFDRICDVFLEHAPQEAMELLPGHAYYLAKSEDELKVRFRHELLPLLDEYLREGFLGAAATDLYAVRDEVENLVR
jgi:5-methylcytosine-specific restriction protein B